MMKNVISEGNKVELQRLISINKDDWDSKKKTYYSLVTEVIDEDRIKITMPFDRGRVVPLPVNARYMVSFYTDNGIYQGRVIVLDRFKEDNIYMLVVELTSDLVKFQRRQYYRLGCTMDIWYKKLEEDSNEFEVTSDNQGNHILDASFKEGTALDISGGGVRFASDSQLQEGDNIFLFLEIEYENEGKKYGLNARVISSAPMQKRRDSFEHRVEFKNIDGKIRESLIRYIFEEERRQRKKENNYD